MAQATPRSDSTRGRHDRYGAAARRTARLVSVAALAAAALAALVPACMDDVGPASPCTNVPPGGCPLSRGVACEDPACEAVYACRPGNVWELDRRCPPRDPVDASTRDASAADADAGVEPSLDASLDAPPGAYGGPGCGPLQLPDCSLGFALACPSGCCGCEDLFVCENGGWSHWSACP